MTENRLFIPFIILGAALVLSAFILSGIFRGVKSENQTLQVKGYAKKVVVSDLGILRGTLLVEAPTASEAYHNLQAQKVILILYLKFNGFSANKVNFQPISTLPNYTFNQAGQQTGTRSYTSSQMMDIRSSNVKLINSISLDISSLIGRGVNFRDTPPEYYYTKIDSIKGEIQAEAAKDARIRGLRIAEAADCGLGTLKSAQIGALEIAPENSNLTAGDRFNATSSIRKEISAMVNASFEID